MTGILPLNKAQISLRRKNSKYPYFIYVFLKEMVTKVDLKKLELKYKI